MLLPPAWLEAKNHVLGPAYELSLVWVTDENSRELNRRFRGIDCPTNILSFPLTETEGEIFLNRRQIRRDRLNLFHLFIHGLLHLKGYRHSSKMEREERQLINSFSRHDQTHRRRTRYRHRRRPAGGLRGTHR